MYTYIYNIYICIYICLAATQHGSYMDACMRDIHMHIHAYRRVVATESIRKRPWPWLGFVRMLERTESQFQAPLKPVA